MIKNPKILIVGPDETLPGEVEAAIGLIQDIRPVTHYVSDFRKGAEMARNRHPDLALVEMGKDLLTLKTFVEEVRVASPSTVVVAVFHPTIFGPEVSESAIIIEAIRCGVRDFLRRPLSTTDLDQFIDREFRKPSAAPPLQGKVLTFFTNKGGVGKSTLSLSTACLLAKRYPDRVLLVDASIQMGICATMLDLRPTTTLADAVRERDRLDTTLIRELSLRHSSGLHLLAAPKNALEAALIDDEIMSRVLNLARRTYDYVVVDTFPMLDRVMMSVLDLADCAYMVTESTVPILEGTARMMEVLDELGYQPERRRLILNRYSTFVGNLKPEEVSSRMGLEIHHVIPYEKRLLVSANVGSPYVLQQALFSKFTPAVDRIVDEIVAMAPQRASAGRNGRGPQAANPEAAEPRAGGRL